MNMYVNHFKSVFKELWKTEINLDQRIKDIEQGLEQEVIEPIENPSTIQESYFNILSQRKRIMQHDTRNPSKAQCIDTERNKEKVTSADVNSKITIPLRSLIHDEIQGLYRYIFRGGL